MKNKQQQQKHFDFQTENLLGTVWKPLTLVNMIINEINVEENIIVTLMV